jgi:hypothetical protein
LITERNEELTPEVSVDGSRIADLRIASTIANALLWRIVSIVAE